MVYFQETLIKFEKEGRIQKVKPRDIFFASIAWIIFILHAAVFCIHGFVIRNYFFHPTDGFRSHAFAIAIFTILLVIGTIFACISIPLGYWQIRCALIDKSRFSISRVLFIYLPLAVGFLYSIFWFFVIVPATTDSILYILKYFFKVFS